MKSVHDACDLKPNNNNWNCWRLDGWTYAQIKCWRTWRLEADQSFRAGVENQVWASLRHIGGSMCRKPAKRHEQLQESARADVDWNRDQQCEVDRCPIEGHLSILQF